MPRWHPDEGSGACQRVAMQDGEARTFLGCLLVVNEEPHQVRSKQCLSPSAVWGVAVISGERLAGGPSRRQLSGLFAVVA